MTFLSIPISIGSSSVVEEASTVTAFLIQIPTVLKVKVTFKGSEALFMEVEMFLRSLNGIIEMYHGHIKIKCKCGLECPCYALSIKEMISRNAEKGYFLMVRTFEAF